METLYCFPCFQLTSALHDALMLLRQVDHVCADSICTRLARRRRHGRRPVHWEVHFERRPARHAPRVHGAACLGVPKDSVPQLHFAMLNGMFMVPVVEERAPLGAWERAITKWVVRVHHWTSGGVRRMTR